MNDWELSEQGNGEFGEAEARLPGNDIVDDLSLARELNDDEAVQIPGFNKDENLGMQGHSIDQKSTLLYSTRIIYNVPLFSTKLIFSPKCPKYGQPCRE